MEKTSLEIEILTGNTSYSVENLLKLSYESAAEMAAHCDYITNCIYDYIILILPIKHELVIFI